MTIRTRLGAQRYNDRMGKLVAGCRKLEHERLERGEMPNPALTSPEVARQYGWEIVGPSSDPSADCLTVGYKHLGCLYPSVRCSIQLRMMRICPSIHERNLHTTDANLLRR